MMYRITALVASSFNRVDDSSLAYCGIMRYNGGRNGIDITIIESQQLPRKRNTESDQCRIQANDEREAAIEKAGPDHHEAPIYQR